MYLFFQIILLVFFSAISAIELDTSISALYSLEYHLDQLLEGKQDINFELDEVNALWERAQSQEIDTSLKKAKKLYDQKKFAHAKKSLSNIRAHLIGYPNFNDNPYISAKMRESMADFLLPLESPLKPILDALFSTHRVTENKEALKQGGFRPFYFGERTFITVASHPATPGYLFKIYYDEELRTKDNKPGWKWLVYRCMAAKIVRDLIKKKKIQHFVAPDKWIYPLPVHPDPIGPNRHPVIMVVTDMQPVKRAETHAAWAAATPEILDELYCVFSHGVGNWYLIGNVPFTKSGKFAFIDLENPHHIVNLEKVKPYLSEEMQIYWDHLIKHGGK